MFTGQQTLTNVCDEVRQDSCDVLYRRKATVMGLLTLITVSLEELKKRMF